MNFAVSSGYCVFAAVTCGLRTEAGCTDRNVADAPQLGIKTVFDRCDDVVVLDQDRAGAAHKALHHLSEAPGNRIFRRNVLINTFIEFQRFLCFGQAIDTAAVLCKGTISPLWAQARASTLRAPR